METGSNELKKIEKALTAIAESIETAQKPLSEFEMGQMDGLRWALDVIEAIKSPDD